MADLAYPVVVSKLSEEDGGGYIAMAPDLRGCVGDGATPEDAITDIQAAILEWCEEAGRLGREIPAPGSSGARFRKNRQSMEELLQAQRDLIKAQDEIIKNSRAEFERLNNVVNDLLNRSECGEEGVSSAWIACDRVVSLPPAGKGMRRRKESEMAH